MCQEGSGRVGVVGTTDALPLVAWGWGGQVMRISDDRQVRTLPAEKQSGAGVEHAGDDVTSLASARSSVIGPSCVGGPAAQGLTNSAGLAEFAGCGVPGSADPFSRPRRGATTPPNGKFGAPLPALSAASADPLARPGTDPSLYAISSSLRAIARADRQDSRGLDVQRRWPPRSAARSRRCRASSSRINASRTRRPCVPHRRRRR
jgi:hypothetical protein